MQIVGLSTELWLVLIIFLTVWPFAPFAPFLFSMLNLAVVVVVNSKVCSGACIRLLSIMTAKCCSALPSVPTQTIMVAQLIHVIRFASRGGTAKRLENEIFWFKRPSLLLHPVKMVHTVLCTWLLYLARVQQPRPNAHCGGAGAVSLLVSVVLAALLGLAIWSRQLLLQRHDLAEAFDCSSILGKQPLSCNTRAIPVATAVKPETSCPAQHARLSSRVAKHP